MKTITFRKVKSDPDGLTEFVVEKPVGNVSVNTKLLKDARALRQALATFWFQQNHDDAQQDMEFKIEMEERKTNEPGKE